MILLIFSLGLISGIIIGNFLFIDWPVLLGTGLFLFLFGLFFSKKNILILFSLFLIGLVFGWYRYQSSVPKINKNHIASYVDIGQKVTLVGWIDQKPEIHDQYKKLVISCWQLVASNNEEIPVTGHIQVNVSKYTDYFYGDLVEITGELVAPPIFETFDYRNYLEQHDIYGFVEDQKITNLNQFQGNILLYWLYRLNQKTEETIDKILPEFESSLLAGLLLGIKRDFSESLTKAFSITSTSHIIALSGFNISIIVGAIQALIGSWIPRKKKFWVLVSGIILFVLFVGATPSIIRAGIMASFILTSSSYWQKTRAYY